MRKHTSRNSKSCLSKKILGKIDFYNINRLSKFLASFHSRTKWKTKGDNIGNRKDRRITEQVVRYFKRGIKFTPIVHCLFICLSIFAFQ
jgi:hypothetical protein